MKKIRKINLELNKEVISSLSNEDMNQVKGGASTYQTSAIYDNKTICMSCPIETTPTASGIISKCLCLYTENCLPTAICISIDRCPEPVEVM